MTAPASDRRGRVPLIGIAGGIASGKSLVTEQLQALGAAVIVADQTAHEVLKQAEVKLAARERWGDEIFGPDGEIDRARLGKIVFAPTSQGPVELEYLEQLVHPRVRQIIHHQIEELARLPQTQAIVLDVPLLFESGWDHSCDTIVFVDAPREVRVSRAAERGWTSEEFDRREATQDSISSKRERSSVVIDNSGTKQATRVQVDRFWQSLSGVAAAR
jgi:dephospho-CoA kinase